MKGSLLLLLIALALPTEVDAELDPKIRKACLPAVDFEGCVRSFSKSKKKVKVQEYDFLGQPVIPNWDKVEDMANNIVFYINNKAIKKVNARGEFGRYISYDQVTRWYQEPVAGTSGYSTNIGSSYTNCSGYGSSLSCTTSPAPTLNIPGRSAVAGGVRQKKFITVIDCLEETFKTFGEKKKWIPLKKNPNHANIARLNCHIISTLPESNFQKFAKGKPTQKDKIAKNTLSKRYEFFKAAGFQFRLNEANQYVVVGVFEGMPAKKAGILENDLIIKINNISTQGLSQSKVVELLNQDKLILEIERDGDIKNISLTRSLMKRFVLTKS